MSELNSQGIKSNSFNFLERLKKKPEDVTRYMEETEGLIGPTAEEQKPISEGYEGITKEKKELKDKTELQELIDLAVKGIVKAYAGHRGLKSGLDLSATEIATPDRSASYARGIETLRSKEDEVRGRERSLDKTIASRERRYGELISAGESELREERRIKEREEDRKSHERQFGLQLAREARREKELQEKENTQLWATRHSEVVNQEKRLYNLVSQAQIGIADLQTEGSDASPKARAAVSAFLEEIGRDPADIQKLIAKGSRDAAQKELLAELDKFKQGKLALTQSLSGVLAELRDGKKEPTEEQQVQLDLLVEYMDTPTVHGDLLPNVPIGTISYLEGSKYDPTNPEHKEAVDMAIARVSKDVNSYRMIGGTDKEKEDKKNAVAKRNKLIQLKTLWERGSSPEILQQHIDELEAFGDQSLKFYNRKYKSGIKSLEDLRALEAEVEGQGFAFTPEKFGIRRSRSRREN